MMLVETKVLAAKVGGAMILAASSDAFIGATATIVVGFLAAFSAIIVAWIQNRQNRNRDDAVQKVIELTNKLGELEHQRAEELAEQLRLEREEHGHD